VPAAEIESRIARAAARELGVACGRATRERSSAAVGCIRRPAMSGAVPPGSKSATSISPDFANE
jgi:hypothetical protein